MGKRPEDMTPLEYFDEDMVKEKEYAHAATIEELKEILYPIGLILELYQDIDPGELIGFGEWKLIGKTLSCTFLWKRVR